MAEFYKNGEAALKKKLYIILKDCYFYLPYIMGKCLLLSDGHVRENLIFFLSPNRVACTIRYRLTNTIYLLYTHKYTDPIDLYIFDFKNGPIHSH